MDAGEDPWSGPGKSRTTIGKVLRVEAKIPRGGGATRNNNTGFERRRGPQERPRHVEIG